METISHNDFAKVEIRTGTIIRVEDFDKARKPALKLWIDFGELGIKKSSAQITAYYGKEALIGKQIVAVLNFPPRQIADFMSECLVLGAVETDGKVVLLQTERPTENGLLVC
jgi:tRNA-binding protein